MMDVVGVTQHHDAVTGTANQHVANDYHRLIFKAIGAAQDAYFEIIDRVANSVGIESSDGQWEICKHTDGSYKDCPIED